MNSMSVLGHECMVCKSVFPYKDGLDAKREADDAHDAGTGHEIERPDDHHRLTRF